MENKELEFKIKKLDLNENSILVHQFACDEDGRPLLSWDELFAYHDMIKRLYKCPVISIPDIEILKTWDISALESYKDMIEKTIKDLKS